MPIYGEAKRRNMIRSVLPSTRRRGARMDLASIKRRSRRNIRQALNVVTIDPEAWDSSPTVYDYPDARIAQVRNERRDADNVAALRRWAPSQVVGIRPRDALTTMKNILPDNLIGRHALTHVDDLPAFKVPEAEDFTYGTLPYYDRVRAPFPRDRVRAELVMILAMPGAHRRLNGHLIRHYPSYHKYVVGEVYTRRAHGWENRGRYLKHAGDIEEFMDDYAREYIHLRYALDKTWAGE